MGLNNTADVSSYDLIPDKTYVKAVLRVKPPKPGAPSLGLEAIGRDGVSRYLNIEATIVGGKYNKKPVFTMLCTQPNGTDSHAKWEVNSARMLKFILEQTRNAHKTNNPMAYRVAPDGVPHNVLINAIADAINGKEVLIKVVEQEGKDGYDDKNSFTVVPRYDDKGNIHKDYTANMAGGATGGNVGAGPAPAVPAGFGNPTQGYAPQGAGYPGAPTVPQGFQNQQAPQGYGNPAPQATYGYPAQNTAVQQPQHANAMAGSPPSFIDSNEDIPFDPNN